MYNKDNDNTEIYFLINIDIYFKKEVFRKVELQSVEEFFNIQKSVESYNNNKIRKLKWECADVLFSFRGIYAIGVFVNYRKWFAEEVKTDIVVKDKNGGTRQLLYSDKYLRKNCSKFSDVNNLSGIKKFLQHYYDIGNVIPTWPGANVNRGMAHCYDIPNVYYKRHAKFTRLVYGLIYKNAYIEEILNHDKYDTVEKLLNLQTDGYVEFLEYIVGVIIKRNRQLQDILREED